MAISANTVTLGEVRLSYCNLFQPRAQQAGQEPKYSVTVLVPKNNAAAKASIDAAVNAAIDAGVAKTWNGIRPPQPAVCVHDGDGPRPSDGMPFGDECKGHWVFTASSKADRAPFIVDANLQPILQQSDVYSGMYGRVSVTFFAYSNSGKKGIGCGLNGVQKLRDGEPLGNRVSAEEAFGQMPSYMQQPAAPSPVPPAAAPAYPSTVQVAYPGAQPGGVNPFTGQPM